MEPGQYTELFFLDEATALAAGHRPCATCRRQAYDRFKSLWFDANGARLGAKDSGIGTLDAVLHRERVDSGGYKKVWASTAGSLPEGTFVAGTDDSAWLLWGGRLHRWSPEGYTERVPIEPEREAKVLTPPSTVTTLATGYVPSVHESAS